MRGITEVTEITLTVEEREQLETLVRSTMRRGCGSVLGACCWRQPGQGRGRSAGGCAVGTASKWRVRYARNRLVGLSEVGDRGAEGKYGTEHQQAHSGDAGSTATCGLGQLDGSAAGARTRRHS